MNENDGLFYYFFYLGLEGRVTMGWDGNSINYKLSVSLLRI